MMMTVEDIKNVARLDMVKYPDAVERKRNGLSQHYINFELENGGYGAFDENQDINELIEINY